MNKFVSIYLDNILIFIDRSLTNYCNKIKKIFERLNNTDLSLDIDKYKFKITNIKYLDFIIDINKKISIDSKKIRTIKE